MTSFAEAAIAQIASRMHDYRQLARTEAADSQVALRRFEQPWQTRHTNALTDLVAVAESFVYARLLDHRPELKPEDISAWEKRKKAWAKFGPVDLTAFNSWQEFMGFVHVRNAIQHGLGRLTDQQFGKYHDEVLAQIRASSVELNGDLLVIVVDDVYRCGKTCADLVTWLDRAVPEE